MNKPNLAIYSVYFGPTSAASFSRRGHSEYPSYFFSNNKEVLSIAEICGWNPIYIDNQAVVNDEIISSMQSKTAKAVPQLFEALSSYDYLLYIDDKYVINETLIPGLVTELTNKNAPIGMKKHRFLSPNVYSEYMESLKQPRYYAQKDKMSQYIKQQVLEGMPTEADIHFETGCILRDMKHPDCKKINELWLEHIRECGTECQVSFFFIARRFPNILVLPTNIFY